MIIGEIKERPKYNKWNRIAFERYLNSKNKKEIRQIIHELTHLRNIWGVFPYQYFIYNLYLDSCQLSLEEIEDYVPEHIVYFHYYTKVNGTNHMDFSNKKYLALKFEQLSVPAPEVYFFYENNRLYNKEQEEISINDAYNLLPDSDEVLNKPYFGSGGHGISFFSKSQINPQDLKSSLSNLSLTQRKVKNLEKLMAFHPKALNTCRVITIQNEKKVPEVVFAFLRVGRGDSKVDNIHMGGIFVGIDIEYGILFPNGYDNKLVKYLNHPDSGILFDGFQIPDWQEIKTIVTEAAFHFGELKIIGWDIALTTEGPMVIEINTMPDINLMQACFGGIRRAYEIDPANI